MAKTNMVEREKRRARIVKKFAAKRADRVGIKTLGDGKRVRFFKSSGEMLDV